MLADGSTRHVATVKLLVDAGANINLADSDGATPLQNACKRGCIGIEKILVAAGAR